MSLLILMRVVKTDRLIDAEFIGETVQNSPPECFVQWHSEPILRRGTIEQTVGFRFCVGIYKYGKIVPL